MKSNTHTISSPLPAETELAMDATFETDVTASRPNGDWTLTTKFTAIKMKVNGRSQPGAAPPLAGKSFSVTMDKDGKVIDVLGVDKILPGIDLNQIASQMNPTAMFPSHAVRVGESWPFEITTDIKLEFGVMRQTINGKGTLQSVSGSRAIMDFEMTLASSMSGNESMTLTGAGKGKGSLTYDIEKARAISNKTDLTMETSGEVRAAGQTQTTRSSVSTSVQLNLIANTLHGVTKRAGRAKRRV